MDTTTVPTAAHASRAPLRAVFSRYVVVGLASVAVDVGSLFALRSGANLPLLLATTIAFALALTVNYSLNHVWAFDASGLSWRRIGRYSVLVAINYGLTLGIVASFDAAGASYLVGKAVAVAIGATINFTGYRFWVFNDSHLDDSHLDDSHLDDSHLDD
jgi:putative flippase GtrA